MNSDPGRRAPPAFRADGAANGGHRSGEILRTRRAGTVVRDPLAPSHRAAARAGARLLAVRWTLATALAAIARSRRTPPRRGTNPGSGTPVPHPATVPRMPAHPPTLTSRHPSMPNVCSTTCRTSRCPSNDRSGVRAVTRTSAGRSWWGGSRAGAPSGTPGTAPTRACAERNCIVCNNRSAGLVVAGQVASNGCWMAYGHCSSAGPYLLPGRSGGCTAPEVIGLGHMSTPARLAGTPHILRGLPRSVPGQRDRSCRRGLRQPVDALGPVRAVVVAAEAMYIRCKNRASDTTER